MNGWTFSNKSLNSLPLQIAYIATWNNKYFST